MNRNDIKEKSKSARQTAYKLAAGAAAASIGVSDADAAVQYFEGPLVVSPGYSQPIDFNLDGYYDIYVKNYPQNVPPGSFPNGNYQSVTVGFYPGKTVGFSTNGAAPFGEYVTALTPGTFIDYSDLGPTFYGTLSYGYDSVTPANSFNPNAQFNQVTGAYMAFAFPIGPTDLYFAWMRLDVDNVAGTLSVIDWAYEDQQGQGITVGDMGVPPILGDFDEDQDVDGADYIEFARNFGTPYTASDLSDFQMNYGTGVGSLAAATSVPEPGTLGLLAAGACGLTWMRRRRAQRANENRA